MIVPLLAAMYCGVQSFRDYRRHAYVLASIGVTIAATTLFVPVEGAKVSVTIPIGNSR